MQHLTYRPLPGLRQPTAVAWSPLEDWSVAGAETEAWVDCWWGYLAEDSTAGGRFWVVMLG